MKNGYIERKRSETDSDSYNNIYIYIRTSAKNNLNENI